MHHVPDLGGDRSRFDEEVIRRVGESLARPLNVDVRIFFFQAEDGIRDLTVTGVQTCALPISPWGAAINFDDAHSDEVRHYFLRNALYWITEFHFDALRLDAVHAIVDNSAETFLEIGRAHV